MVAFHPKAHAGVVTVLRGLANLLPLIGVVAFGWEAFDLLVLYWLEVLLVGICLCVVLSSKLPEQPHEYGSTASLLITVSAFAIMTVSFATILVLIGNFFFWFTAAWSERLVVTIRDLRPVLLALVISYAIWLLSMYLPGRAFTDEAVRIVSNRLFVELTILMILACIVAFVIKPFFESALGVLVLVVLFKTLTSGADYSRRPEQEAAGKGTTNTGD